MPRQAQVTYIPAAEPPPPPASQERNVHKWHPDGKWNLKDRDNIRAFVLAHEMYTLSIDVDDKNGIVTGTPGQPQVRNDWFSIFRTKSNTKTNRLDHRKH